MSQPVRPRLLLHVCCGPCATAVVERLDDAYEVELFWFNPNIEPEDEYERRLAAARQLAAQTGRRLVEKSDGREEFGRISEGREDEAEGGERCRLCYELRLRTTMDVARAEGIGVMACTLSISPHKDARVINEVGQGLTQTRGVQFLSEDFSQSDGFRRSVEMSRALGLYRQNYCGCLASRRRS
jgi:epoxyqueuosine reductase